MKFNTAYRFTLLLLSTMACMPLYPLVIGYTRLYRPDNNVTIDIVHDYHIKEQFLSGSDFIKGSPDVVKELLYPTEQALIASLDQLNTTHPMDTTVIWESDGK